MVREVSSVSRYLYPRSSGREAALRRFVEGATGVPLSQAQGTGAYASIPERARAERTDEERVLDWASSATGRPVSVSDIQFDPYGLGRHENILTNGLTPRREYEKRMAVLESELKRSVLYREVERGARRLHELIVNSKCKWDTSVAKIETGIWDHDSGSAAFIVKNTLEALGYRTKTTERVKGDLRVEADIEVYVDCSPLENTGKPQIVFDHHDRRGESLWTYENPNAFIIEKVSSVDGMVYPCATEIAGAFCRGIVLEADSRSSDMIPLNWKSVSRWKDLEAIGAIGDFGTHAASERFQLGYEKLRELQRMSAVLTFRNPEKADALLRLADSIYGESLSSDFHVTVFTEPQERNIVGFTASMGAYRIDEAVVESSAKAGRWLSRGVRAEYVDRSRKKLSSAVAPLDEERAENSTRGIGKDVLEDFSEEVYGKPDIRQHYSVMLVEGLKRFLGGITSITDAQRVVLTQIDGTDDWKIAGRKVL